MIDGRTYYAILQVDPSASQEVIESSFKRLSGLYQSGYNGGGDARSRLRELREAYDVLRLSDARLAYDARLRRRAALFDYPDDESTVEAQITQAIPLPVEPRRGVLLEDRKPTQDLSNAVAWLAYTRHRGGDICFKIDKALDLHLVLSALRTQVPEDRRRYEPTSQEWQVAAEFEPVLETLFLNYGSLVASKQIQSTELGYSAVTPVSVGPDPVPLPPRTDYVPPVREAVTYGRRINWPPILIAMLSIALFYNVLLVIGGNTGEAVAPTPTLDLLAIRPTPARLPTRTPTPVIMLAEPQYLSIHLRTGPGEEYDSLGYLYQGTTYQAVGRNQDGTWIKLVVRETEAGSPAEDPLSLQPQSQVLATPTPPLPAVTETGWSAAWVLTLQGDVTQLPLAVTPQAPSSVPPAPPIPSSATPTP